MILPDAVEPTIGSVSRAARWPGPQRRVRNEDADESSAQPLVFADAAHRVRSAEGVLAGDHQVAVRSDRQIERGELGIGDQARCALRSAAIEHDDCLVPRRTVRCPTRHRASRRGQARTRAGTGRHHRAEEVPRCRQGWRPFPSIVRRIVDPRGLSLDPSGALIYLNSRDDRALALDRRGAVVRDSGRVPA